MDKAGTRSFPMVVLKAINLRVVTAQACYLPPSFFVTHVIDLPLNYEDLRNAGHRE